MRRILVLTITLFSINSWALKSPIPSTIPGIDLPNAHFISEDKSIIRGMAPHGHYDELLELNVSKVLIFKKQSRKEVDKEIEDLKSLGFEPKDILHVPFQWHDFESQTIACEQTIDALNFLFEQQKLNETVFLHCTVGEDRTGHLSALFRIIDQDWSIEKAFEEEMCERGYGRGNKNKPNYVVTEIREDLTPIFLKMAQVLKQKYKPGKPLKKSWCKGLEKISVSSKKCGWSSIF